MGRTDVTTLIPDASLHGTTVIYCAGGTYSSPIGGLHWRLIERVLRICPVRVVVPHALLAPEHTVDEALPDLACLLASERARSQRLTVAGDSSGGGLALALAQLGRDQQTPPDALALLSPWVDVTLPSPVSRLMEPYDPVMRMAGPRAMGRVWAGARSVYDPLVSPIHADLKSLPPMLVCHGGRDLSLPDTQRFIRYAAAQGNPVREVYAAAGIHVYPLMWWTPEARVAHQAIAQVISGER